MKCPHCGTAVPEGAKQCPGCGNTVVRKDEDVTWGGLGAKQQSASRSAAADDLTDAGFKKPRPQTASDVLTPPPAFLDRKRPSDDATWVGGANSPTIGPSSPTMGPEAATLGPNSPTINRPFSANAGWGTAAAPAFGGQIDFGPRYRVEKLLGQGGMGAVYKAYDLDLDRMVALKLVRPELMVHADAMARFRQELLLASKISHRNILRIHDLGDAAGMKFISMAYVDGEDLHHILLREGRLPLPRMLNIAKQLCSALDAAHAEHVVHRDLKPQNIMLGANDLVQVSDFGLAKSIGAGAQTGGMTQSGEMLGTPRYMAPEQVEAKSVDERTDLYALGLIFYEMVTGDVPFTAETTLQLMYKRAHETPPPPRTVVPDLPLWLNNVIFKCLACNPADRYQTARDILYDLENETGPDLPQKPEPKRQITLPVISKKWLVSAVAAVVLIGGTLAIPSVRHRIFGAPAGTTAEAPPVLKSIAILPLRVSGNNSQDLINADGIVDALSAKLFQLKNVHLASPNDVARLKSGMSIQEMGQTLGVGQLVEGTYQVQGDKFRLIMTLNDAKTGSLVWTKEFTGIPADIISIEDSVYSELLKGLKVNLSQDEVARTSAHVTDKVSAYEAYLRGRNDLRGKISQEAAKSAIGNFNQALKEDGDFALAYAGMADAYLRMFKETKDAEWANKAVGAAEAAGVKGPNFPEVHFVLSSVYRATGKSAEAIAEIKQALALAPNSDEGYRRLGDALKATDEDGAIKAYQKAIEINPYYWYNYNELGTASLNFGNRNDEAINAYKKVIEIAPKVPSGYTNLGAVYLQIGKYEEAIPQFQAALNLDPNFTIALGGLGNAYFFMKKYSDAATWFEKQVSLSPNDETAVSNLGDAYRFSGDKPKADAMYERAITLEQKALQVNPRDWEAMAGLALCYAKKGDAALAQQYIRSARSVNPENIDLIYYQGEIETLAGHDDDAVKTLAEAFKKGYAVDQAQTDPDLTKLMSRPDFAALLKSPKK